MEMLRDEKRQARQTNRLFLEEFATSLGGSLDKLGKEYDEMIHNFEQQKFQLKNFVPNEEVINENETLRPPSPTPSGSSQSSGKKDKSKKRTGIQSSIRSARNTLRRKFTGKNSPPSRSGSMTRKKDHNSVSSLPTHESESSSVEH